MIQHEDRHFNDMLIRPYGLTRRILSNFYNDELEIIVCYGMPEGIGKTAYINHSLADVYGYINCHERNKLEWLKFKPNNARPKDTLIWDADYEAIKRFIVYKPEEVNGLLREVHSKGIRYPALHWDDGGTWINTMSYNDPWVIDFMTYLPLARSHWAAIILTTPVEDWVLKKLRTAQGLRHIRITKLKATYEHRVWKPRKATCYSINRYIGSPRSYYPHDFEDQFPAIMPDDFYDWYKPRRDSYAKLVIERMWNKITENKQKERPDTINLEKEVMAQIEASIGKNKDQDFMPEIDEIIEQG